MKDAADKALEQLGLDRYDVPEELVQGLNKAAKQGPKQYDRDALKTMTPEQIEAARKSGRLDDLLGRNRKA